MSGSNAKPILAAMRRSLAEMEGAVGAAHPDVALILDTYGQVLRKAGRKGEGKEISKRAEVIRSSRRAMPPALRWTTGTLETRHNVLVLFLP